MHIFTFGLLSGHGPPALRLKNQQKSLHNSATDAQPTLKSLSDPWDSVLFFSPVLAQASLQCSALGKPQPAEEEALHSALLETCIWITMHAAYYSFLFTSILHPESP